MRKSIGIVRNKTVFLSQLRRQNKSNRNVVSAPKGSRFSKQRLGGNFQIQMTTIETPQTMKKPFIQDLSTVNTIQQPKPQWIFYYEECLTLLKGVEQLRRQMLSNQNKRLTCIKVSEEKGYQMKIYDCAKEATGKIKKCQKIVELIKTQAKSQTSAHAKVCNTVVFRLANDIQETTKQLRHQQKSFVQQRKQFQMTEKPTFLELAIDETLTMGDGFGDELIEDEAMRDLQQRNEEIKKIVESIYELNDIYKQLSSLVVLQGSLLDRIDENIEVSRVAVSRGLEHLISANKHQKRGSRCSCMVTSILLLANVIVLIILCHKWFSS